MSATLWIGLAVLVALIPLSYLVEALRPQPVRPQALSWAPGVTPQYVAVDGVTVRYIRTGSGPVLLLLHTLRTQLDIFQKVIPTLAGEFTVIAVDYPGHGWSDIPRVDYTPAFFTRFVAGFLEALKIEDAVVAGVSIGASIPLLLAADHNPRIRGVVSINPYDYGSYGVARANLVARILFSVAPIPILGETVMRLRNRLVEGAVFRGGVASPAAIPPAFGEELFVVGERPGYQTGFLNLIRHMPLWRQSRARYGDIQLPVLLLYGDHDWSRPAERAANARDIPGARMVTVEHAGHFMPLDRPDAVIDHIRSFVRGLPRPLAGAASVK
jgi:pimeloyl-ACP methyl ester carboxylesterase